MELTIDSMEHRINWLGISKMFCDLFRIFFKNNVVEIVNKMSTLDIHMYSVILIMDTIYLMLCSEGCLHLPLK